jgi:8-oxo-dGTP diphosphatase
METLTKAALATTAAESSMRLPVQIGLVVMSVHDRRLHVLVQRDPAGWRLPGERVDSADNLDACARHAVRACVARDDLFVEQLYTFGGADSGARNCAITVCYYAAWPWHAEAGLQTVLQWRAMADVLPLSANDRAIVDRAYERLKAKLSYSTLAFHFLPEEFTLTDVQTVHEVILGETLDKRNFRKRMLAQCFVTDAGACRRDGSHRPARLYRYTQPGEIRYLK